MEHSPNAKATADLANQPSLVEHFSLEGLYGYRNVSLESKFAATVLIARNGSGKTTLIAALDAFLRGQFSRFSGLRFSRITCRLRGCDELLIVEKSDVDQLLELSSATDIGGRAKTWEVEPLALLELLESNFQKSSWNELYENPTFYTIFSKSGWDTKIAKNHCEKLADIIERVSPRLAELRAKIRKALSGTEVVYLPTYRRIELSLNSEVRTGERRKSVMAKLGVARGGLYTADIQFGLSDIAERLRALYSEMLYQANQGYGKVSANIINDLISDNYRASTNTRTLPSKESLEIFFDRLKNAEREYRHGPFSNFPLIPNLNRVYSDDVPEDARPFLTYFLDQLNSVIEETRGTEELVAAFIGSCNKYLSGEDSSTGAHEYDPSLYDKKELAFTRKTFQVQVNSVTTGAVVPMEALSSGEKQMISLFARLYLYPGKKLVLIDEPELSLSLDWQRQILPDVLMAPNCRQVIAITHSPFIFDNALEPFAGSLNLRIVPEGSGNLFPDLPHSGVEVAHDE